MAAKNGKWEKGFPYLNADFFQLLHGAYHNNKKKSRKKLGNPDLWLQFRNVTSFAQFSGKP